MTTIYLVGQISPKFPITYEWRENVIESLNHENIEIINPCANSFNSEVLAQKKYAINGVDRYFGLDVLPPKDLTYVQRSDIGMVT
jgi:hypothetical protein